MSMRIEVKCGPCGDSAVFDTGTFIRGGGIPDAKGRVYISELRADEWHERHANCKAPKNEIDWDRYSPHQLRVSLAKMPKILGPWHRQNAHDTDFVRREQFYTQPTARVWRRSGHLEGAYQILDARAGYAVRDCETLESAKKLCDAELRSLGYRLDDTFMEGT